MSLIEEGIRKGIISLDIENHTVTYVGCQTKRSFLNPEEKVQVNAYVKLVTELHYPPSQIKVCHLVKMGSSRREADMVAFSDAACKNPELVVECKKRKISAAEFKEAIEQGFSYASATGATFVWATSDSQNAYFEYWPHLSGEREKNRIPRLPAFQQAKSKRFRLIKRIWKWKRQFQRGTRSLPKGWLLFLVVQAIVFTALTAAFFLNFSALYEWVFLKATARWGLLPYYLTIGAVSVLLGIVAKKLLSGSAIKNGSQSAIAFAPFVLTAFLFPSVWWNEVHYTKIGWKSWLFFQPYLWVLGSYLLMAVCRAIFDGATDNRKGK